MVGFPSTTVSLNAMPSMSATGVRFMRFVTSPTAQIEGTVVCE